MGTHPLLHLCRRVAVCTVLLATIAIPAAYADYASDLLSLVNAERSKYGLAPLSLASELNSAAYGHSKDMATNRFFSHTGSDGSTVGQRLKNAGYYWSTCGENIAAGQTSAQAAFNAWMSSSGHRANILSSNFKEMGVGYVYDSSAPYRHYWTQDFGARSSSGGGGSTSPTTPPAPSISSISPTSGPSATTVTISGSDFGTSESALRVMVRSVNSSSVYGTSTILSGSLTNTSVKVQIYPSSTSGYTTGQYYVWVRRYDTSTSFKSSNAKTFTFESSSGGGSTTPTTGAPSISSISPTSGPAGTTITITGSNFVVPGETLRVLIRYASASYYGSATIVSGSVTNTSLKVTISPSSYRKTGTYYVWIRRYSSSTQYTYSNYKSFTFQ